MRLKRRLELLKLTRDSLGKFGSNSYYLCTALYNNPDNDLDPYETMELVNYIRDNKPTGCNEFASYTWDRYWNDNDSTNKESWWIMNYGQLEDEHTNVKYIMDQKKYFINDLIFMTEQEIRYNNKLTLFNIGFIGFIIVTILLILFT